MTQLNVEIAGIPLSIKGGDFHRSLNHIERKLIRPFVVQKRRDQERHFQDVTVRNIEYFDSVRSCKWDPRLDRLIRHYFYYKEHEEVRRFFKRSSTETMLAYLNSPGANRRMLEGLLKDGREGNNIVFHKSGFVIYRHDRQSYEVMLKERDRSCKATYAYYLAPLRPLFRMVLNSRPDSLLLHASSIEQGGNGYAFLGRSGSGKSTVVAMLEPDKVLSDDTAIIRRVNGQYQTYPNPWWNNDKGMKEFDPVSPSPLKALFFIAHSKKTRVRRLNYKKALFKLLSDDGFFQQIDFFDNKHGLRAFCVAAQELLAHIPAFQLDIQRGPEFKKQFIKYLPNIC
jgi:hypothetical protein